MNRGISFVRSIVGVILAVGCLVGVPLAWGVECVEFPSSTVIEQDGEPSFCGGTGSGCIWCVDTIVVNG